jgi:hypothetical protein
LTKGSLAVSYIGSQNKNLLSQFIFKFNELYYKSPNSISNFRKKKVMANQIISRASQSESVAIGSGQGIDTGNQVE